MIPVAFITPIGGIEREKYFDYWVALCRSMLKVCPGMSAPWYITSDKFSEEEWARVLKEYPNARQHLIDPKKYDDPVHKSYPAFWKFEAANPVLDAKHVISIEADLLCDNNWTILAYRFADALIYGCKEPNRDQYGAAILIINRVAGYEGLYEKLLATKHDGGWGTDQNIWNQMPIVAIPNVEGVVERMGWPQSKEKCEHPIFWNLWGKTLGESNTIPYVWKLWRKIMGKEMPRITSSACGKYGSIENKMREAAGVEKKRAKVKRRKKKS